MTTLERRGLSFPAGVAFALISVAMMLIVVVLEGPVTSEFFLLPIVLGVPSLFTAKFLWRSLRREWRQAKSAVIGLAVFIMLAGLILRYTDTLHFHLLKPLYLAQLASKPESEKHGFWRWDGGSNYDVSLQPDQTRDTSYYIKTNATKDKNEDQAGCKITRRDFGDHFLLTKCIAGNEPAMTQENQ